jgi:hypothetical protein
MTNHGVTMTNYDDNYYGAFLAESLSVHKDCLKCVKFLYSKGPLIIYCTGGAFKFFKGNTERNTDFEKIQRDERRGALKRFTSLKKH